jgi:hypothetical protein
LNSEWHNGWSKDNVTPFYRRARVPRRRVTAVLKTALHGSAARRLADFDKHMEDAAAHDWLNRGLL